MTIKELFGSQKQYLFWSQLKVLSSVYITVGYCLLMQPSVKIIQFLLLQDVCPENLLWYDVPTSQKPNTVPVLKLIDFNLSRKIPSHSDHIRADALGNPSYMAPECLSDYEPIATCAADIWSVGVLMFLLMVTFFNITVIVVSKIIIILSFPCTHPCTYFIAIFLTIFQTFFICHQAGYPPFFNDNYNHLLKNIAEANCVFPKHLWSHVTDDGQAIVKEIVSTNKQKN